MREIVFRATRQNDDLRVDCSSLQHAAEPQQPGRISVHKMIVEYDSAFELIGDRKPDQDRELVARADGQRIEDLVATRACRRRLESFRLKCGIEPQPSISPTCELFKSC